MARQKRWSIDIWGIDNERASPLPFDSQSELLETVRDLRKLIDHQQQQLIDQLMKSDEHSAPGWCPPEQGEVEGMSPLVSKIRKIEQASGSTDVLSRLKATWIYRFYRKYLKQISLIQRLVIWIWQLYILFINRLVVYFAHKNPKHWRPLIKLSDYVKETGIPTITILKAEQVEAPEPKVFPIDDSAYLSSPQGSFTFPPVYVATVSNTLVYGGTNLVFTEKTVICHDLYDFERDATSEELHGRHLINAQKMRIRLLCQDNMPEKIPVAATFVDACAQNYAHWLTEILPRIAVFCAMDEFKDIPILINDSLHENILESLFMLTGADREIIAIPVGRALKVDSLYIISVVGYVPWGRRDGKLSNHSHGQFSPSALELTREKLIRLAKKKKDHEWPELIYLRRNSGTRKISNAAEIEKQFSSQGYVIIESEKLTFMQQVQLFSSAKEIVSSTGAALANGIFCKPGTRIGVLMAKHEEMIYRYWVNMLAPIKIKIIYLLGVICSNQHLGMHGDFTVSQNDVKDLLRLGKK